EAVLAARARHHRRQFRVGERAREAQEPGRDPRDNHDPGRLDVAHHHARLQEDARADDAPDDNRDRREEAEAAYERDGVSFFVHKIESSCGRYSSLGFPPSPSVYRIARHAPRAALSGSSITAWMAP